MTIALESCDDSHLLRRCCSPEAEAERTRRPRSPHTQALRESRLAQSGDVESDPGGEGAFLRVALGSPADRTSARQRWEDHSGRSREPSSAEPDERCRVQTFEAGAQRRGVPGAQEWQNTRHGGVHDHAEKCNDEPEQPSSGRNSLYTRRARRGGLGLPPRPRVACE